VVGFASGDGEFSSGDMVRRQVVVEEIPKQVAMVIFNAAGEMQARL
jgi:hypothetical protein